MGKGKKAKTKAEQAGVKEIRVRKTPDGFEYSDGTWHGPYATLDEIIRLTNPDSIVWA